MLLSELTKLPLPEFHVHKDGEFSMLSSLEDEGMKILSFLEKDKYLKPLYKNSGVSCIVIPHNMVSEKLKNNFGVISCDSPRRFICYLQNLLLSQTDFYGDRYTHENNISDSVKIDKGAMIAEHGVTIGCNTEIGAGAIILPGVTIGENCRILSGSVLGGEGLQCPVFDGVPFPVDHGGRLFIGNNVVIRQNCNVDRGVWGVDTVICDNVQIDSRVNIGHAAKIESGTRICAGAIVSGNCHVGKHVWIGVGAMISNRVTIPEDSYISIGSVVILNMKKAFKTYAPVSSVFPLEKIKEIF